MREAGFEVYLPLRRELHQWKDRKKWVEVPLIKSYIFVKIAKKDQMPVNSVTGVSYIVKFKNEVATIPDDEIQIMKDFLAEEVSVQIRNTERLKKGRRVRISEGALSGREGVLVSDCEDGNFAVEITGISMAMVIHVESALMEPLDDTEQGAKHKEYYMR